MGSTFRIIVIVTLVTILTPVESKGVHFVARSLLHVFPPSNPPSETESPPPAPAAMKPITISANPPTETDIDSPAGSITPTNAPTTEIDSPAPSPEALAGSVSSPKPAAEIDMDSPAPSPEAFSGSFSPAQPSAEIDTDSPAPSPEAPADSVSPAQPPAEIDMDSPPPSLEAPTDSDSPAQSPAEIDMVSPAPSAEAPADSVSPTNPPSQENSVVPSPTATSGKTFMNKPKNILNQPLLSPEIKSICGKTDFPPLCESSVSPLLTAQLKPDASTVLVLAIQSSINATKAAMAIVDKVAAADCQELYDDAVANLEDAINAVKSRDIATVNTNLSAAMTDYSTCNDGFEESGEPNPLAEVGDKLTNMVSNCLAISTLIK
ncbi:unnamed protein product [Thlaspi arvense]|uniref:Pectinesterase inhibitor domain-containing protein n=1 Tax=Thlaspi arvense TaxID=13288 RepID=A0AAU9S0Y5_THLAR|nr:unnamed protein product [Thlaspi arvense]